MIDVIRSEWIKFRSVRSTVVMLLAGGALTVLFALLLINDAKDDAVVNLTDISAGVSVAAFLFGTLGVQIIGQEYRFNTIRTTFSATPRRPRVLVAKLLVVASACAAMSIVMLGVCIALGSTMLSNFELDGVDQRALWGTMLFAAGWAAAGMAVGAIVRQPVAGIVVLMVEAFVAESLLASLLPSTATWLPFSNGFQMTLRTTTPDPSDEIVLRSVGAGGVYFFVVVALALAVGFVLVQRRDA